MAPTIAQYSIFLTLASVTKGNAVIGTRYGRFNGMFGANEMSICKQDLILQEELNCETSISVREAASQQSLSGKHKKT
jgi:hypothetical protein